MKRNCLISTVLIVAFVCFLQVSLGSQQVMAAAGTKPKIMTSGTEGNSVKAETAPASIKHGPRITFAEIIHDFGNIEPGTRNTCEFKFTNTGDSPLKITDVSKSCGCTTSSLEKEEYGPGESGILKVDYHASLQPASITKTLVVSSNDETKPKVELTIKAEIVSQIDYQPKKLNFVLNKENAGCQPITIKSVAGKPFSIKGFKAFGQVKSIENVITADYNSLAEANEFVLQPKVNIEKLQGETSGRIEITVARPQNDVISIPFEVLPKFKVTPPSIIVYKADMDKPVTREVWVISNYDENFEVESASSQEGDIKVLSQEKVEDGPHYKYKFVLEIAPPATEKGQKGYFTDVFFVKIKGGETLRIACRMFYMRKSPPVTEKMPPAAEKLLSAPGKQPPTADAN